MDYKLTATEIINNIGGKDNIAHLEHCSTRLRFTLNNEELVNIDKLEKINGVIGVRQNVQCQVIIGNDVIEVYDELIKLVGDIQNENTKPSNMKKIGAIFLDFLVSVFQPLVPAIAGGGILKSFVILFAMLGWMDDKGSTYEILQLVGTAPIYFLPLLVAITTANKLKINSLVAVSIVSALLLPDMMNILKNGSSLLSFSLESINYSSQVFPAILTVLFYSIIEKFFTKYSFKVIRIFFVPMMSLLITVPVALLILGPIGYNAGTIFSSAIVFFYDHLAWGATGLLAAVLPLMVVTGMHKAMLPYAVATLGKTGTEMLYMPASLAHNIAESGACFAVSFKTKDSNLKSTAISAGISALFGITEPALYGVTIIHKRVFYSVMGAALIGGAFSGIFLLKAFVLVGPGLASITMFVDKGNTMNFIWALATFGISFVLAFLFSIIFFKDAIETKGKTNKKEKLPIDIVENIKSPLKGTVIPMNDINDHVFSSGMVGKGIGIIPQIGELKAPANGVVSMVFHTNHALNIKLNNGADLFFHIGIDTVKLDGDGFEALVKVGDIVHFGDELIRFDLDKIKNAGLDPTIICLVANQDNFNIISHNENEIVSNEDIILEIQPKIKKENQ